MKKDYQLTFYKADYAQYNCILEDDEIRSRISEFLLKYVSLEAFYKKMLVAMRESNGQKLSKKEKNNLSVTVLNVKAVLNYFDINYDDALIERVFGSNDSNYMECSVKKLRNRMVHNVNDTVLRIILERYENVMNDLNAVADMLK